MIPSSWPYPPSPTSPSSTWVKTIYLRIQEKPRSVSEVAMAIHHKHLTLETIRRVLAQLTLDGLVENTAGVFSLTEDHPYNNSSPLQGSIE